MPEAPDPLAVRAVSGCPEALAAVWAAQRARIASILFAHAPRGADIDDLLQDVALKLVRGIAGVRDAAALDGWLRTTAVHVARDAGRRRSRAGGVTSVDADDRADDRVAAAGAAREELEAVDRALAALTADQREVLLLRSRHGLGIGAIAGLLGISEHAAESRLARARARLQEVLDARDGATAAARPGGAER